MSVYLIRHGESLANLHADLSLRAGFEGIDDAHVPLSGWGYQQAREAGQFLRHELQENHTQGRRLKIIRSPFSRTGQTTEGLLNGMQRQAEVSISPHLREQDFGMFSCITDRRLIAKKWPEAHDRFVKDRQQDKYNAKPPQGESRADVVKRARQLVEEYRADFADPNTDVVLIGHGLANRAVEMCLRGLDKEWLRREPNPGNCDIRKLEGDLQHGYTAQYIYRSKERLPQLPKDYLTLPHGQKALSAAR